MENKARRICGTCAECCKTCPVIELKKRAGKWCGFRAKGKGCRIYQERPKGCIEFECQWLKGYGEESDRPNQTGIVIDFHDSVPKSIGKIKIIVLFEGKDGALGKEYGQTLITQFLRLGYPILQRYLSSREVFIVPQTLQIPHEKLKALVTEKRRVLLAEVH